MSAFDAGLSSLLLPLRRRQVLPPEKESKNVLLLRKKGSHRRGGWGIRAKSVGLPIAILVSEAVNCSTCGVFVVCCNVRFLTFTSRQVGVALQMH